MDAQVISFVVWIALGGAGFAAGLVGLATTRRRLEMTPETEAVRLAPSVGMLVDAGR